MLIYVAEELVAILRLHSAVSSEVCDIAVTVMSRLGRDHATITRLGAAGAFEGVIQSVTRIDSVLKPLAFFLI